MGLWKRVCLAIVTCSLSVVGDGFAAPSETIAFNRDIRQMMSDNCFACHGPAKQKGNLRLDQAEFAFEPGKSGKAAIVQGKPDQSELVRRILASDEDDLMPPPDSHKVLKPEQKELFKKWIAQGAPYEKHWSYVPPVKLTPPAIDGLINPIDAFIAQRLGQKNLKLQTEADRNTLIRRVSFALTGLPPTPEEVKQYVDDKADGAYERMVDRYLASPRYGEEMARHWLDVARYADTHGLHLDNERQMWLYRDWVVSAFNRNLPFDQFTIDQLAGDLLPRPSRDQLIATGFNRCNVTTSEGGSINAEYIFRYAQDRTTTTVQTWLGMTAGCATCHDHKFDPLTMKEYYSLYAFFNNAADPPMDGNALLTMPILKTPTSDQEKQLAAIDAQLAAKQKEIDAVAAQFKYEDPGDNAKSAAKDFEEVWFDDDFPAGAKPQGGPGHATTFVDAAPAQVFSGKRALKRTGDGISQDYFENGITPLEIPAGGKLFAHVWIDPAKPPKAVMLQYFKKGWLHRAVWGDYEAIQWGKAGTAERVNAGPLPSPGQWTRIEIDAAKLGFKPGDQITGFAFTQFGGLVYWDKAGIRGRSDPARDPLRSFKAWWQQRKEPAGFPNDLKALLKQGPDKPNKPEQVAKLRAYYVHSVCRDTKPRFGTLANERAAIQRQRDAIEGAIPATFVYNDMPAPRESFVMQRGAYDRPGEKVEPATPAVLPPLKKSDPKARATRLDLANWLIDKDNPLTARVAVNRFWQEVFGVGLVKSSHDFGSQGEPPSHPELLDYLAIHFRESGWDVKQLVRMMVTSRAFRQSAAATADVVRLDPENRLYARGPRIRLTAEQIRDNVLFVSGLINLEMGGRGVRGYQPPNIWEPVGFAGSNTRFYKQDTGPAIYKRSLYMFFKRTAPPPFLSNFDAPNREGFCTLRERSNTPLQALQLLNDVQHFEAARSLAQRMMTQGGATPAGRIAFAYRVVLAREPEAVEASILEQQFKLHLDRYTKDPESARQAIRFGDSAPQPGLNESELAAWALIANTILNLDETVNRN